MFLTPSLFIFISTIILRTIIAISSTNWLMAWVSIELNLLSFIPIIITLKTNQETEGAVKYFLAQAVGSALILLSRILIWYCHPVITTTILALRLLLKLGAAPCHFWFPQVITSISWINCLIAATWQKIAPLLLLIYLTQPLNNQFIIFICILNRITGGILGINQTHLRTLLAYSSITHIGWTLAPIIINSPNLSLLYFTIYCLLVIPIFINFAATSSTTSNQLRLIPKLRLLLTAILLLSLAGLPPLTGFIPKWIVLKYISWKLQSLALFLLLGSYLNLYFYLVVTFSSSSSISLNTKLFKPNLSTLSTIACSRLGLIILLYALTFLY